MHFPPDWVPCNNTGYKAIMSLFDIFRHICDIDTFDKARDHIHTAIRYVELMTPKGKPKNHLTDIKACA
jgi:hypothetical protein